MTRAFLFPGQGSQKPGMGYELAQAFTSARETFEEIDDALNQKLSAIMFEGPTQTLNLTENTQPAMMAVSMAIIRVLTKEAHIPLQQAVRFVAGHSVGEYSALCATHSFSLGNTARLLKCRGQAMQQAVPIGKGAMLALLGVDWQTAQEIAQTAAENDVCTAANDNAPDQVVISGHRTAIERAITIATQRGCKRTIMLPVSAPFHCSLMKPAAQVIAQALEGIKISPPSVPLIANVSAQPVSDPESISRLLVEQTTGAVQWYQSIKTMRTYGVHTMIECGTGNVLSNLNRRIDPTITSYTVNTPTQIETLIKNLL